MPYKDPEKQKATMKKIAHAQYERKKAAQAKLKLYIMELQKTINLMRMEHYPTLPLIEVGVNT